MTGLIGSPKQTSNTVQRYQPTKVLKKYLTDFDKNKLSNKK